MKLESALTLALGVFGFGFSIWAFYVREGAKALIRVKDGIEKLVAVKLENIELRLDELIRTSKEANKRIYHLELDHDKRIALLEQAKERYHGHEKRQHEGEL